MFLDVDTGNRLPRMVTPLDNQIDKGGTNCHLLFDKGTAFGTIMVGNPMESEIVQGDTLSLEVVPRTLAVEDACDQVSVPESKQQLLRVCAVIEARMELKQAQKNLAIQEMLLKPKPVLKPKKQKPVAAKVCRPTSGIKIQL